MIVVSFCVSINCNIKKTTDNLIHFVLKLKWINNINIFRPCFHIDQNEGIYAIPAVVEKVDVVVDVVVVVVVSLPKE